MRGERGEKMVVISSMQNVTRYLFFLEQFWRTEPDEVKQRIVFMTNWRQRDAGESERSGDDDGLGDAVPGDTHYEWMPN
jgi:hypothetical protein